MKPRIITTAVRLGWWVLALVAGGDARLHLRAQEAPSVEYRIKAACLLNFAKFIEWPPRAFSAPDAPLVLGILGKDPFGEDLEATIAGKSVEQRPLHIRRLGEGSDVSGCHILFISASERRRMPQILQSVKHAGILTISETDNFLAAGGIINFILQDNTVRFEINAEAAEKAGLKISSKLLQIGARGRRPDPAKGGG